MLLPICSKTLFLLHPACFTLFLLPRLLHTRFPQFHPCQERRAFCGVSEYYYLALRLNVPKTESSKPKCLDVLHVWENWKINECITKYAMWLLVLLCVRSSPFAVNPGATCIAASLDAARVPDPVRTGLASGVLATTLCTTHGASTRPAGQLWWWVERLCWLLPQKITAAFLFVSCFSYSWRLFDSLGGWLVFFVSKCCFSERSQQSVPCHNKNRDRDIKEAL